MYSNLLITLDRNNTPCSFQANGSTLFYLYVISISTTTWHTDCNTISPKRAHRRKIITKLQGNKTTGLLIILNIAAFRNRPKHDVS